MAPEHLKRGSTSFMLTEVHVKTTGRQHFPHHRARSTTLSQDSRHQRYGGRQDKMAVMVGQGTAVFDGVDHSSRVEEWDGEGVC